jgi:hypothetical protein
VKSLEKGPPGFYFSNCLSKEVFMPENRRAMPGEIYDKSLDFSQN